MIEKKTEDEAQTSSQRASGGRGRAKWLLGLPAGALLMFVLGAGFAIASIVAVEVSSGEKFCLSCHEMQEFVYEEYKQSIHYSNRTGVRAQCKDCHLPKPWVPKIMRKFSAMTKELPGHLTGRIDTREKFEAHRLSMAESVWQEMRESDSRECRSCHDPEKMNPELQDRRAARKHARELPKGKTCIDCHQGIAHVLPELPEDS